MDGILSGLTGAEGIPLDLAIEHEDDLVEDLDISTSYIPPVAKPNPSNHFSEIGGRAVWTLSSAKMGTGGIKELRDDRLDTFWQSDGPQPHSISIQFPSKTEIKEIHMYVDFKQDESYTPQKLHIKAGTTFDDLQDLQTEEFDEPSGWIIIPLNGKRKGQLTKTNMVQLLFLANHLGGKDVHVRQVKIFGPPRNPRHFPKFKTTECLQYAAIR